MFFHRVSGSIPHRQPRCDRQQATRSKVPHFVLRLGTCPSLKILIRGDFWVKKKFSAKKKLIRGGQAAWSKVPHFVLRLGTYPSLEILIRVFLVKKVLSKEKLIRGGQVTRSTVPHFVLRLGTSPLLEIYVRFFVSGSQKVLSTGKIEKGGRYGNHSCS